MDITLILVVLTAIISVYAWSNPTFLDKWILSPFLVAKRQEYYRFLTSGFLHADWMHLLFNMFAFFSFGQLVQGSFEQIFGFEGSLWRYLMLYLGGIIVSDIPTYFRHRRDPDYRSLGASGGVASVIFSGILFQPIGGIHIFPIPFSIPGFIFGFLYLGYSYYMGRRSGDNINHDAHFYGALYGVVLTLFFIPQIGPYFIQQIQQYLF
ncbi:rhomboid family intramembrane serine protease [Hymenobacter sp. NBH84]|uniref:rhomboid family intramembrane serine protease n=1 Tax=Hymenobacter sp. NBH84 TaxID=2596915 RepID=UPI00162993A5|nr:rhomboid family intramembrane serine protease [Hymenobacter sp. NBH84]QNE41180.1 rhomboid family intramembrane serine protease [Hymenobacter sp. NBH84]